jgi:HlyD family secretion protein
MRSSFRLRAGVVAGLLLATACGPGAKPGASPAGPGAGAAPVEVRTARVARAPFERSVAAVGELAAFERVVVATKVTGRLGELFVDRGDAVAKGAPIGALESREYELRLRQAEAALETVRAQLGLAPGGEDDTLDPEATAVVRLARAELERARLDRERAQALAREGVDSKAVSERAESDFLSAQGHLQESFEIVAARRATLVQRRAELGLARAQLEETRIEAPFDGFVVERRAATGAYLGVGAALVELVRTDPLRLVLEVGEREAGALRVGQTVRARIEGREELLLGVLARLSPAFEADSRMLAVEAELPNPGGRLRPGSFAEARIVTATEELVLCVPPAVLVSFAGLEKAFVVRDGELVERRLVLGRREAERVEVLEGLAQDEEVVLSPGKLAGGTAVRVVR